MSGYSAPHGDAEDATVTAKIGVGYFSRERMMAVKIRLAVDCRAATKDMSGVGRYIFNLLKGIAGSGGFQLFLLVRKDFYLGLKDLESSELVLLPEEAQSIHYVNRLHWEQRFLRRHLHAIRPHLFHATWNYGVPWLSPCPTVLTLHDLLPMEFPGEFGSRSWRYAYLVSQHIALRRANSVIAVSEATRNAVLQYAAYAAAKTRVVWEGVEDVFSPPKEANDREYLLYVGGYGERKNVGNLFRAYQHAFQFHGVSLPLHLTGSMKNLHAADREIYDHLADEVRGKIAFLGFIRDEDLPRLYQRAAMLVFPSLGEGFGFPPLEAMACATPVVTTKYGSIPEIVGNAARFVDGLDFKSIAQGISDLAKSPPQREALVQSGLDRAKELSWKTCSDATIRVYEETIQAGRNR